MKIIEVLLIVALISIIAYNIVEIFLAGKWYRKIEKEHKKDIDDLIDKIIESKFKGE